MARWTFSRLDNSESYVFEISPNEAANAVAQRGVTWSHTRAGFTGVRTGRTPQPWEFSGALRSEAHYDALLAWLNKRVKVRITTDLGQQFTVRIVAFKPEQSSYRILAPYRHTYAVSCLILS